MSKSTMIDYAGSSSGYHTNPFSYSHNQGGYYESLTEVLVNEAAILYKKKVKDFTNQAITDVAADNSTNVLSFYDIYSKLLQKQVGELNEKSRRLIQSTSQ